MTTSLDSMGDKCLDLHRAYAKDNLNMRAKMPEMRNTTSGIRILCSPVGNLQAPPQENATSAG